MNYPQQVKPETVDIGDTVRVEHKPRNGVTTILEGTVGKRVDMGETRHMMTAQGSTLFSWGGRKSVPVKIWLLKRAEQSQEALFT